MTPRSLVKVRKSHWSEDLWEVLCPCCASRKPGVAILGAFETWRQAFGFAHTHGKRVHR